MELMTREAMIGKMLYWADRIAAQNEHGALHIFVADGNCDYESIDFCRQDSRITEAEREFLDAIVLDLPEEAIAGAWALSELP